MRRPAFLVLCVCALSVSRAQPALKISGVSLAWPDVRVSFSVHCGGEQLLGLARQQFVLEENGTPVNNFSLGCPDDLKRCSISAALLFDASSSMKGDKIKGAKEAGMEFVDAMDGVLDEACIFRVAETGWQLQTLTTRKELLDSAIQRIFVGGATSVWDACITGLNALKSGAKNPCTAMVLLTDGIDGGSTASVADVIGLANAAGIRVFTIGIGDTTDSGKLSSLARLTGGGAFFVLNPAHLADVYHLIATIVQRQSEDCTLRYSGDCSDGVTRTLRMIVSGVCEGADTAMYTFIAPANAGGITPMRLRLSDEDTPARETASLQIVLADTVTSVAFPPVDFALRYDSTLLRFKRALIPPASLLPPGPVIVVSSLPGRVQLRIPSRSVISGSGVLADLEFEAFDPADTAYAAVSLDRWIFDDGCLLPSGSSSRIRIIPCRWKPSVDPAGVFHLCAGDTIVLRGEGGFAEYVWYRDSAVVARNTPVLRVTRGGRYRLATRDRNGCSGESEPIDVVDYGEASVTAGNPATIAVRPGDEFRVPCLISPAVPRERIAGGSVDIGWNAPELTLVRREWLPSPAGADSVSELAVFTLRVSPALRGAMAIPLAFSVSLPNACIGSIALLHPTVLIDGYCEKLIERAAAPRVSNAPNPVAASTLVSIDLDGATHTRAVVLDAFGREVARLADGLFPAGRAQLRFDAAGLAPGMYAIQVTTGGGAAQHPILVLR